MNDGEKVKNKSSGRDFKHFPRNSHQPDDDARCSGTQTDGSDRHRQNRPVQGTQHHGKTAEEQGNTSPERTDRSVVCIHLVHDQHGTGRSACAAEEGDRDIEQGEGKRIDGTEYQDQGAGDGNTAETNRQEKQTWQFAKNSHVKNGGQHREAAVEGEEVTVFLGRQVKQVHVNERGCGQKRHHRHDHERENDEQNQISPVAQDKSDPSQ